MNQSSTIPFGTDASKVAGYAYSTDRLGNVDFLFENTGTSTLSVCLRQYTSGNPSSYTAFQPIVPFFTVAPGGTVSKSLVINSKMVAFFGSGGTTANVTAAFRNPSDLRGAQIDIVPIGRFGWGFDTAFPQGSFLPDWPSLPTDGSGGGGY